MNNKRDKERQPGRKHDSFNTFVGPGLDLGYFLDGWKSSRKMDDGMDVDSDFVFSLRCPQLSESEEEALRER
jgi:hypothetical protein